MPKTPKNEPPIYFQHVDDLANYLSVSVDQLLSIAADPSSFYYSFDIKKKSGGSRQINPPVKWVREIHSKLLYILSKRFPMPKFVCGGVKGRSIKNHAGSHVGQYLVFTTDIANFFPSVPFDMVFNSLKKGMNDYMAEIIGKVCYNDGIPQGSPTSMFLANLSFSLIDKEIIKLCNRKKLNYSRYVDDIALSADYNFKDIEGQLFDIIDSSPFCLSAEKTIYQPRHHRQIITNLVVNDKIRPTKKYKSNLKNTIWECIENGPKIIADEQGLSILGLKNRLNGQVNFVMQFDTAYGNKLKGLLYRLWNK